jgi:predicted nucleotidyltransferase
MQAFLEARRSEIAEVCRTHHVRRLAVFGSAVRDDFDPARSDIDLLVEFEPRGIANRFDLYFDLHSVLEGLLLKKVDLIEAGSIRNPYLQKTIEHDQRTLYAA